MPLTNTIIKVSDYGVYGDYNPSTGTGTDDTGAINAAIAAAKSGDLIVFPAPLAGCGFKVSSLINIAKKVAIDFNNGQLCLTTAAAGLKFNTGAEGAEARNLNILGKRLAGQVGVTIYADSQVKIQNSRIDQCDIGIDLTGGVWHAIDNVMMRNHLTGSIQIGNVVGPSIHNFTYDTDTGFAQPQWGIRCFGEGVRVDGCDIIRSGICLLLETVSTRDCTWNMFSNCTFDTSTRGVLLRNYNAGRKLNGTFFNNCWSASHVEAAFQVDANQPIDGVSIKNGHIINNQKYGVILSGAANNVDILGCEFGGNSAFTPGGYSNIYVNSTGSTLIRSNTFGKFGAIGGTVSYDVVRGTANINCVFSENWSDSGPTQGVVNGAGGAALRYGFNYGYASPTR